MARQPDVGGRAEEQLREYFLLNGYFVVRGLKLEFGGDDVTDLDLWLYLRPSPLSRERVNVDAKYRTKPQAMERVLWAKGVQAILGLERCIVATTDKRPSVKEFGERHGVLVLDGHFLSRLSGRKGDQAERLTEEGFLEALGGRNGSEAATWKRRLIEARSRLLTSLDYDGCNLWLDDASFFLDATFRSTHGVAACRLFYLTLSYFLLGLDYSTRHVAFEELAVRKKVIEEGLRYGSAGRGQVEGKLRLAAELVERFAPDSRALGGLIKRRAMGEIETLQIGPIADFFSKTDVGIEIFAMARELEAAAFKPKLVGASDLSSKVQGCIATVLDLNDVERTKFFEFSRQAAQLELPVMRPPERQSPGSDARRESGRTDTK